jgi:hypothetical protein
MVHDGPTSGTGTKAHWSSCWTAFMGAKPCRERTKRSVARGISLRGQMVVGHSQFGRRWNNIVGHEGVEQWVGWALAENGWGGGAFYKAGEGEEWMGGEGEWWPTRWSFNGIGSMRNRGEAEMLGRRVMMGKGEETMALWLSFSAYKGSMAHGSTCLSKSQWRRVPCTLGG